MIWHFDISKSQKNMNDLYMYSQQFTQENQQTQDTTITFQAFVDSIIPRTPELAKLYGEVMYYGALDFQTDEFLILSLNSFFIPLATPVAQLLDLAAKLLAFQEVQDGLQNDMQYPTGISFAGLSPTERFQALTLLFYSEINRNDLPTTFKEYPEMLSIIGTLNNITLMGYYSEWFGYGTTRLLPPNERALEFFPLSWSQIGYPGPSFSYIIPVKEYYKRRKVNVL